MNNLKNPTFRVIGPPLSAGRHRSGTRTPRVRTKREKCRPVMVHDITITEAGAIGKEKEATEKFSSLDLILWQGGDTSYV